MDFLIKTKICTKCLIEKPLEQFSKNSRNKTDGKQPKCKSCNAQYEQNNKEHISIRSKQYRKDNSEKRSIAQKIYRQKIRDKAIAYAKQYYQENKNKLLMQQREYYQKNKLYISERSKIYAKNNRPLFNAHGKKRKLSIKNAIPKWANDKLIKIIYARATELTNQTGILHHVDHIVPIQSKLVCGLHCEDNLRVIPASENCSKQNRYWDNMP